MALTKVIGAGAEGLTLSSTSLTVANGLTLTDGNVTLANGHGIDFAATTDSGGMSAELFSDFETGSWTPTVTNGTGYNAQFGNYTKIGRLVFINGNVETSSTSSAGNVISGLPFASLSDGQSDGNLSIGYYSGLNEHVIWIGGYVLNNSTNIYLVGNADGHTGTTIQKNGFNAFSGNTRVMFSGVYQAAS